jgi:hypothetical protein
MIFAIDKGKIGSVFPFLKLPTELRVEIYQYSLITCKPIVFRSEKDRIHRDDKISVNLLRTCHQINSEGSQVFYGDNKFRFEMPYNILSVLQILPAHNFNWLKELTVPLPGLGIEPFCGFVAADLPPSLRCQVGPITSSRSRVDYPRTEP